MTMICFYTRVVSKHTGTTVWLASTTPCLVVADVVVPSPLTMRWRARLAPSPYTGTTRSMTYTADCLREVYPNVEVEPQLQPLMAESLALLSARVADGNSRARHLGERAVDQRMARHLRRCQSISPWLSELSFNSCASPIQGRRNTKTAIECEWLSSAPLHPLFFPLRVKWELKLRPGDSWLDSYPSRRACRFTWQWSGWEPICQ